MSSNNHKNQGKSKGGYQERRNAAKPGHLVEVPFKGHRYRILPREKWTIDMLEHLAEAEANPARVVLVVKAMLGSQWQSFKDRHVYATEIEAFFNAGLEAAGAGDPKESLDSLDSSD